MSNVSPQTVIAARTICKVNFQKQSRSANTNSYVVPPVSTTSRQQSFFPRTIRDWNQLSLSIKKAGSVSAFKAQLDTHFNKLGQRLSDPHPTTNHVPITTPLAHVFNMSMQEEIVPLQWKEANIIPLFKKKVQETSL